MSSPKKLLVILGITGQQGSSIATLFLSDPSLRSNYCLRGITRNLSKPSNAHLRDAGVDLVAADLDDVVAVLEREGVEKFVDAWQELLDSMTARLA